MTFEGAVRVPLVRRWPGVIPAGRRCDELVQWHDLGATVLDAARLSSRPRGQAQRNLWDHPRRGRLRAELQVCLLDVLVATEERSQPREAYR